MLRLIHTWKDSRRLSADEKISYIRSSATTIKALDGLGALPQETLEYLEIQPPAEAMLPWTDLDDELSNWRKNQAFSPHQRF